MLGINCVELCDVRWVYIQYRFKLALDETRDDYLRLGLSVTSHVIFGLAYVYEDKCFLFFSALSALTVSPFDFTTRKYVVCFVLSNKNSSLIVSMLIIKSNEAHVWEIVSQGFAKSFLTSLLGWRILGQVFFERIYRFFVAFFLGRGWCFSCAAFNHSFNIII